MRVPVNPQTRVPTGQLGYEQAVDVTAGTRTLAAVVDKYAQITAQDQKKKEIFDVQKLIVDETNNIQTDFDAKTQAEKLGAPNFTQRVNGEYNTRHQQMIEGLRQQGYSDDAVQEFATRLGTIRSQYVAKAIDFQDKSQFAKIGKDTKDITVGLSQYANKNPMAVGSALDELRVSLSQSGLDEIEQTQLYETLSPEILRGAREGFAIQHPEVVVGLYNPQALTTTSPTNLPQGQEFDLPAYLGKMGVAEGISKNPRSSAVGFGQFLDATWLETYKQVYGNTKETKEQILAKKKNPAIARKLAEVFTSNNVQKLIAAGAPVNEATVYLSHFLGASDAVKVISAHTDQTVRGLVSSRSIAANPTVFKNIKTAADMLAWAQGKMGVDSEPQIAVGNIDVTQLPTVQNADGSVSTVRSISIEEDGKTYLIPTVINGKVVSDDDAVAAFHQTGRHLGIFKDEKSATAYAQQLHESEAQRVGLATPTIDDHGKTGIPAIDLASGPERMQMLTLAQTIMNGREVDAKAAQREAHATWINGFYNKLQDGTLGQADLNTAYQKGFITDFDERKKAQGIIDSKIKKQTDLELFGAMLHSGAKFNPYDPKAQKAVDAGFDKAVEITRQTGENASPFAIALRTWERTGILPSQGAIMIRGGLIGTDPATVAASASVASNMLARNPNAFAGVDGGNEIGLAAANYAHYVDDLGMTAEEAANKIATQNSPEFQAKNKANEVERNAFVKTVTGDKTHTGVNIEKIINDSIFGERTFVDNLTLHQFSPARGKFNEPQRAEARQTYLELALDNYDKTHDAGAANAYASRQMSRFYGVESGRLLKFPATKAYPEIMGSREYIFDQAKGFVDAAVGFPVPKEDIFLQPTASGSTAAAFRAGKPPPYEIHYITREDGQAVYHHIPGKVFVADLDEARRTAAIEARKVEKRVRETVVLPGVGPVRTGVPIGSEE